VCLTFEIIDAALTCFWRRIGVHAIAIFDEAFTSRRASGSRAHFRLIALSH
jgi:hypothetical protein